MKELNKLKDVQEIKIDPKRKLFSATHEEISSGYTTDVYFLKTLDILESLDLADKTVTAEIFPRKSGIFCGLDEVLNLLKDKKIELWSIPEGESFEAKDTVMRIRGPYKEFAVFETVVLGILASSSGWATAAFKCREAAGDKTFICFGSRHVHPAVAPVMERAAVIGGANGASCILAAKLLNQNPLGTVPHAAFLIAGDTLTIAEAYDKVMPPESPRIILVDTFKDEVEETIRVARLLGKKLEGIRLDTPSERGGVTPELVREVRARLDFEGYNHVKIFVSGGLDPERIKILSENGADAFGVGSYISSAPPIDMTLDLKKVEDKPVAKRGRIPGLIENKKLKKFK
ncbi:MAG: nicotinate phosphoribosyltransferase [Thermosediminibacterales bacterium]|nr:nicotinate phosphoribosyltransferase [Thermosediminibacterales bacterium]MDK2835277.1 nicotinate phosphoribosyltransferase [Thermosediminibacterales bacterium]